METADSIQAFLKELDAAKEKHPNWPEDIIHQAVIVIEESGELIKAVLDYVNCLVDRDIENYRKREKLFLGIKKEAIQVGAMALRFLEHLEVA